MEFCVPNGYRKFSEEPGPPKLQSAKLTLQGELISAAGAVYPHRVSTVLWMETMVLCGPVWSHLPIRHHTAS